ncbi:MAG: hypothetical protein FWC40_02090 [Proteobacteria bacterium]|nr:hypothetical protein [Pseudomonadota bacterium]
MRTIALAGQLDAFAAHFSREWARMSPADDIVALSREAYDGFSVSHWRLGSLVSFRDTANMLRGVSLAYYFCLTPPGEERTSEGLARDVALSAAVNFVREARQHEGLHVVLVMRRFPDDARALGPIYHYWREVREIFRDGVAALSVVDVAPMWSEHDALTMGMLDAAQAGRMDAGDIRLLNLVQPAASSEVLAALHGAAEGIRGDQLVVGERAASYRALLECMRQAIPKTLLQKWTKRLTSGLGAEAKLRRQLFEETSAFHVVSDGAHLQDEHGLPADLALACRDFVGDVCDGGGFQEAILRCLHVPKRRPATTVQYTPCYVQRIASRPKRSVSAIADLLMQWLPRYFQRLVRVDAVASSRLLFRFSRIPVLEIEKIEETPRRCALAIRSPWADSPQTQAQLLITVTGDIAAPRELLVIIEDNPELRMLSILKRALLLAFGRYLKEYGVAE